VTDTLAADVLDAVYDVIAANATIAAAVTAGVLVLSDGPPYGSWGMASMLCVGGRVEVDSDDPDIGVTWEWSTSSTSAQVAEVITIPVAVTGVDGVAANMRALRRTVIGYWAAASTALRTSTLALPSVMWCLPSPATVRQMQGQSGAECIITASVHVRTQI
jgi:hypothetical protein